VRGLSHAFLCGARGTLAPGSRQRTEPAPGARIRLLHPHDLRIRLGRPRRGAERDRRGGRYDGLVEQLGGKPTSGIGFGSGVERLLIAREAEGITTPLLARQLDVFVVDTTHEDVATLLLDRLRAAGLASDRAYDQRSMKAQMKVADKSGARLALLVGPQELAAGEVTIRDLRSADFGQTQQRVSKRTSFRRSSNYYE